MAERCAHGYAMPFRDCGRCQRKAANLAHAMANARRYRHVVYAPELHCALCEGAGHVAKHCHRTEVGRARQ